MNMRHVLRNTLLSLGYMHPAALAVTVRRGPRATKQYLSEIYRCSKTDAGRYLPTVSLEALVPKLFTEFVVARPADWGGSLTITEIGCLCNLVAALQPRKILEIGSFKGLTTLNIAMNAPQAEIHTLDLPQGVDSATTKFDTNDPEIIASRGGYYYEGRPEAQRIRQHYGDTATFDYGEIGTGVDFCLIDAAHSYEYVRNDTIKSLPLMSDNSLLLWHDYGRNDFLAAPQDSWGVTRFLNKLGHAGVRILQGTSFGVLPITAQSRSMLIAHLRIA